MKVRTRFARKLTVEENILAVLEAQPLDSRERRVRTARLIHQFNLSHIRTTRGYALSGGERRRVEIARSLCIRPNFILLDEPFSGIDPSPCWSCKRSSSTLRPAASGF